jgi:hypothetical protein
MGGLLNTEQRAKASLLRGSQQLLLTRLALPARLRSAMRSRALGSRWEQT